MKSKKIIIYITDNLVIYKYKKLNSIPFKSIKESTIVNEVLFKKEFSSLIKKENINSNLFGDELYFIVNNEKHLEQQKIKDIFKEYNFRNIILKDICSLLDKNKTYIIINDRIINIISNFKKYNILFLDKESLYHIIINMMDKELINNQLFCISNENEYSQYLIKKNIKVFYIYNPNDYLIDKFEKKVTNL